VDVISPFHSKPLPGRSLPRSMSGNARFRQSGSADFFMLTFR
jgi:hypothetical protein